MKGFFKEFSKFIQRGNVIDLAVGVVIGNAFSAIVTSLVNDIIMPVVSLLTGGIDFSNWFITLDGKSYANFAEAQAAGAATLNFGNLISVTINFLIVALCIFIVIRSMNKFQDKMEKLKNKIGSKDEDEPTKDIKLLTEIRDLLQKQNKK